MNSHPRDDPVWLSKNLKYYLNLGKKSSICCVVKIVISSRLIQSSETLKFKWAEVFNYLLEFTLCDVHKSGNHKLRPTWRKRRGFRRRLRRKFTHAVTKEVLPDRRMVNVHCMDILHNRNILQLYVSSQAVLVLVRCIWSPELWKQLRNITDQELLEDIAFSTISSATSLQGQQWC